MYNFGFFVKNQVFIGKLISITIFSLIALIHMSVFMLIPNCFYYYSSIVELEHMDGHTSRSSFIIQDCFDYSGFFVFPREAGYSTFEVSEKKCAGILMEIALNP